MDSTDSSHWELLDNLIAAATASPPPAPNHWRFATMPPPHSSTATFSVAPTTSRLGGRWAQDAPTDPHCLHRAVSLDSSVPCISPMDPDTAQQCVESLIIRDLAATFPSGYTFQANRQRFGRYSAPVVRDLAWTVNSTLATHFRHSRRVRDDLAGSGITEGRGEHRHIVTDNGDYFFMGASGSSQGIARLGTDLIGIDLIWLSPECEPLRSSAGPRRLGGDA